MLNALKKGWWAVALCGAILFMGSSIGIGVSRTTDVITSVIAYPLYKIIYLVSQPFTYVGGWLHSSGSLQKRIDFLEQKVERLTAENSLLCAQKTHWGDIEEVVTFRNRFNDGVGIICSVIMKHLSFDQQYVMIDGGSVKGVEPDMVAVFKNILVGKVSEVYPFYAKVTLITDRHSGVPAYCFVSGTQGVHEGLGAELTRLNFVGHFEHIEVGEMIITSGQGLIFPQGFAVGRVKKVSKDHLGLNLIIDIEPFLNVDRLKAVRLIKKG